MPAGGEAAEPQVRPALCGDVEEQELPLAMLPAGAGHKLCEADTRAPLPAAGPGCSALTAFPVPLPRSSTGCVWHFSDQGEAKWDRKSLGATILHQQRGKTGTETMGGFYLKGQDARSGPANLHLLK